MRSTDGGTQACCEWLEFSEAKDKNGSRAFNL